MLSVRADDEAGGYHSFGPAFVGSAHSGDTIAIRNGRVVRNGKLADEPFIRACAGGGDCDFPEAIRIPKGYVFVMGDNRGGSDDSRYWGPIPVSRIIGKAVVTYWPPSRVGGV